MTQKDTDLKNGNLEKKEAKEFDAATILEEALEAMGLDKPGPNEHKLEISSEFMEIVEKIGSEYKEAFKELA